VNFSAIRCDLFGVGLISPAILLKSADRIQHRAMHFHVLHHRRHMRAHLLAHRFIPAHHYWRDQQTTVFPRQGHYVCDPKILAAYPAVDINVDPNGALIDYDLHALIDD
jgi:hypothetical protein